MVDTLNTFVNTTEIQPEFQKFLSRLFKSSCVKKETSSSKVKKKGQDYTCATKLLAQLKKICTQRKP